MTGWSVEMMKKSHRISSIPVIPSGLHPGACDAVFIRLHGTDHSPRAHEQPVEQQPRGESANMPPPGHTADVVAEDPESQHVGDDVGPATVEKHASQERPVVIDREPNPLGPLWVSVASGDHPEEVKESVKVLFGQRQFQSEDKNIQPNDRV